MAKVRNGFVTNSSSSSFIIAFDEKPDNAEHLQKILFGDSEHLDAYGDVMTCKQAAEIVWGDITENDPDFPDWTGFNDKDVWDVARELDGSGICDAPDLYMRENRDWYSSSDKYNPKYVKGYREIKRPDGSSYAMEEIDWDLYYRDCRSWAYGKAEEWCKDKGSIFIVSYGDDDGRIGGIMEHGGIFEGLGKDNFIRISHH